MAFNKTGTEIETEAENKKRTDLSKTLKNKKENRYNKKHVLEQHKSRL